MASSPLVSFIIISYKHSDFIHDCIKSILAQTYFNMEILYYVKLLAADDFMLESGIEKLVAFIETREEYDVFRCNRWR